MSIKTTSGNINVFLIIYTDPRRSAVFGSLHFDTLAGLTKNKPSISGGLIFYVDKGSDYYAKRFIKDISSI